MIWKINTTVANKDHELRTYDEYYTAETAQKGFNQVLKTAQQKGFREVTRNKYHNNHTFYNEYTLQSDEERMEIVYYSSNRTA